LLFAAVSAAGYSLDTAGPDSEHYWVFKTSKDHAYVHMSTIEPLPDGRLAVAFQSAQREGNDEQAIFFKRSSDGGKTWEAHRVAVKDGFSQAVWGPALVYNPHALEGRLYMFFSASVPANRRGEGRSYPGGDVYLTRSDDMGDTWGTPQKLLGYFSTTRGNVSKVTANKPAISSDGSTWVLPYWQEKHVATATGPACAGVLVSRDYGQTFKTTSTFLSNDTAGWLIENTIAAAANGSLVQLFRTKAGRVWESVSNDWGQTWSAPYPTSLLNPNSKLYVSTLPTPGRELLVTYNPSSKKRTPLQLSTSNDSSHTWAAYATIDTGSSVAYPTTAYYQGSADSGWKAVTTYSASTLCEDQSGRGRLGGYRGEALSISHRGCIVNARYQIRR